MAENLAEKFIDDLFNLAQAGFSESVMLQAKKCLLDYLGVTLAGAKMLEEKGCRFLDYFGSTQDEATVIGFGRKANLQNAVLMNGICAHVAELDDGERFGMMHPGAPVISALLSLAEREKISGKNFLLGITVGYEAALRIADAIQPSTKERGYHATGTCGTIGAAIGVAAALEFTKSQMKDALSSAATSAAGILKVIEDESELKAFNAGQAACSGLLAATVARAGFRGPDDVLASDRGFLTVMAEQYDASRLMPNQGEPLAIEKIYMKPYAACRHCHPAIEAALKIRSKHGIRPENVKDIKVITYRWAVGGHEHTQIRGVASAKMSTPYSVAVALETGKAGLEEFLRPEYIENPKIISLANKVNVCSDDNLTALVPQKRPAIVEITTTENERYIERVDLPKGEPESPLTEDEVKEKFESLALYGKKSKKDAEEIIQRVWNIENELGKLYELL